MFDVPGLDKVQLNHVIRHDPKAERFSWEESGERLSGKPIGLDEHGSLLVETEAGTRMVNPEGVLGETGEA